MTSGFEHPECRDDLDFEGELALARGLVLSGEYSHGARHAAGCLAMEPTSVEVGELLAQVHAALGELASDVVEEDTERGYWSGEAALRAWMLRAAARREDASKLLLRVIGADPGRPWARLLRSWVDDEPSFPLPAGAVQDCCGSVIQTMLHRNPTETELGNLGDLTAVLERSLLQHPDNGALHWAASGVARRAGRQADAVRWAEEGDRLGPSMLSACMLGYARRAAGDASGAATAFVEASKRAPDDPSPRLDAADSFAALGHWEAASRWASSAWELDPELPTAAARACYAAWRATGDAEHVLRLMDWVMARCPTPDEATVAALGDAVTFALDAQSELPWIAFIPVPMNAAVNIARQVRDSDSRPARSGPAGSARVTFSRPEAPSALLALEHVFDCPVEVLTAEIPEPDPRLPRRKIKARSWELHRGRLGPGVKPPSALALAAIRVSATWLYSVADARRDADRLARTRGVKAQDLLALATHPQPGPSAIAAEDWIRRWQVVCCFALARLQEFDVLTDLADGPEDWLSDAALAGLIELARLDPRRRQTVLNFAEGHLVESARRLETLDLPHFGSECDLFVTIPGRPDELAAAARELKSRWLAYTNEERALGGDAASGPARL